MDPTPTTLGAVQAASIAWLERRGVDAPRRSVELLIQHALGLDRLHVYLQHDRPLTPSELATLRELVRRRGAHEPVAHLLGAWEFFGLELEVTASVLVPRPETEEVVARALAELPADSEARIVDLGTGSGAIAIALAVERPGVSVVAVDVSADALAVAARNVERHRVGARVRLVEGSWWEPLRGAEPFDLVVSNPPYVDPARPELCADDVRRYEPGLALWTPPGQPAAAYEAIAAGLDVMLRPGGAVVLETGIGAAAAARAVLERCAVLTDVDLLDDLARRPRILVARRRG
ncbi:MAG: peptide chain release factor N(5)-glutamine methyltransferase [Planctomycetes bacterium]|nr:peptide chain release factor N(5)-glutamine methyltransferase [Planctomycetota bacterium]